MNVNSKDVNIETGICLCSIILPVYNAETTLRRCVDSVLSQSETNFELIAIDDGSTDNSGKILDAYAQKDSRIKVVHKKNEGVSSARNLGIQLAQGVYTIHVDSDDWVEPNMIEDLTSISKNEGADIVICDFYKNFKERQIYCKQSPNDLSPDNIIRQLLFQQLYGTCWNKLIKKNLYDQSIIFPLDFNWSEDFWVVVNLLRKNPKIAYYPKAYYHYDQYSNNNSLTRMNILTRVSRVELFLNRLKNILPENDYREGYLYQYSKLLKTIVSSDMNRHEMLKKINTLELYGCCKYLSRRDSIKMKIRKNIFLDSIYRLIWKTWKLFSK